MNKASMTLVFIFGVNIYLFSQVTLGIQDFETVPAIPTMAIISSVNSTLSSGTSIVPSSDNSHAATGTSGLINTMDGSSTIVEFDAVDVSAYVNILVSVRVAALSEASSNGMDGGDFLTLLISTDNGASYSEEITLKGTSNAKWGFNTGIGIASVDYDGNNVASEFKPSSGGVRTTDGYSTVAVRNITPTSHLKIKIIFKDDNPDEQWAIDEVKVTGDTGVGFTRTSSTPNEINVGSTTHQVNITKVDLPLSDVTVQITDAGTGTATTGLGNDYSFTTTNLTFTTTESYPSTKTIDVIIHGDTEIENDETIVLNLALTSGTSELHNLTHTVSIFDNDCAPNISDNFTDGDFTNTPLWVGNNSDYSIITDAIIPNGNVITDQNYLGSNAKVGRSALLTTSTNISEWEFSLASSDYNPSTTNYFGVVLMSDTRFSGDLLATSWNGYYLKVGGANANDYIELHKMTGSSSTPIGTFSTTNYTSHALENGIDVKVTRDGSGNFELFYRDNSFNYISAPTTSAGILTDDSHTSSCYFGIFTRFNSASSNRRIYIDNINDNSNIVLPVELISFVGQVNKNQVELNWNTISEINNAYFEIEKRTLNTDFTSIGQVKGNGTTLEAVYYSFIDKKPIKGINYYRLKQVDWNGDYNYSPTISIDYNPIFEAIKLSPIPTKGQVMVHIPQSWVEKIQLQLYNTTGQLIESKSIYPITNQTLDFTHLTKGHYIIRFIHQYEVYTTRFIKI